jgi:hypothetical protein
LPFGLPAISKPLYYGYSRSHFAPSPNFHDVPALGCRSISESRHEWQSGAESSNRWSFSTVAPHSGHLNS